MGMFSEVGGHESTDPCPATPSTTERGRFRCPPTDHADGVHSANPFARGNAVNADGGQLILTAACSASSCSALVIDAHVW
jgi:hypothetical protein